MARGSSYYYKVALFPSRRKEPVENRVNARRAPQDKSFLRRRKLRPLPVRLPHRGPTRIPGWRIHHFLVSEFKMKIRTSLFRKPFLSKKTEAGETWSPWIFFFFSLRLPQYLHLARRGLASKVTARTLSRRSRRAVAAASRRPRSRPRREVRRGSCWLTRLPRKPTGNQSPRPSRSRSAGPGEGRWRRRGSIRSRCRGRAQSPPVDEGGQAVHHGWGNLRREPGRAERPRPRAGVWRRRRGAGLESPE